MVLVFPCGQELISQTSVHTSFPRREGHSGHFHDQGCTILLRFSACQLGKCNNKGGSYFTGDPNGGTCVWAQHDCGNHSEFFSFHGPGSHAVFADGHVTFISESIPVPLIQAMVTRSNAKTGNEPPIENIE